MAEFDEFYDEKDFEDPEDELCCEYGCGLCSEPDTKDAGLCTTECSAYMQAVKEDAEEKKTQ